MRRVVAPVLVIALLGAVAAASLIVLYDQVEHLMLYLFIPLMFLIGAVPIAVRIWRRTFDLCEITVPYFVLYFVFYGAGALFTVYVRTVATNANVLSYLDAAVALLTVGFACLMLGYALGGAVIRPMMDEPASLPGVAIMAALYGVGYVGVVIYGVMGHARFMGGGFVSGATAFLTQISFLSTFSLFYVLFLVMKGTASASLRVFFFGVMIPSQILALFVYVGNKSFFILTLGLPMIAFWYVRRRVPWKSILASVLVVVFIIFPFYYKYRSINGVYLSHGARVEKSLQDLTGGHTGPSDSYAGDALRTVARRMAIVNSTATILRECGRTVEYQYGSTILLGFIVLAIPRLIWEGKPTTMIGTEFGKTFRITGQLDYSAISLSTVGELYWNFHVPGVVLGMFLLGLCLRAIYQRFGANQGKNPVRLAMYVTLLYAFLQMTEGSISGLEGTLIKQAVILLVLEKAFEILRAIGARGTFPQTVKATVPSR